MAEVIVPERDWERIMALIDVVESLLFAAPEMHNHWLDELADAFNDLKGARTTPGQSS